MKRIIMAAVLLLLTAIPALAANYVEPDEFKGWLESGKPVLIVDIQPAADFAAHHFKGAIETNAFPAKSDEEKQRLDKVLPLANASAAPLVVVCPRGLGGAKNAYTYLATKGVSEERMYILEDGIAGWPYPALFVTGR
ncbi:hypothetical protein GURASL_35280 [Geotalea uraniireducens]|uniref:Rhodanese domain-containing protein n=1 Tax=Geotalea uraniireducens TaxID=351604 RepID=A0ABM8EQ60_9BACT|nr:rhodanese-like domain-containing protein [Geotalea uraniireducens]BDV44605.1 hypothetical protein GURASL_35280 [Geotalea uraniireducens]